MTDGKPDFLITGAAKSGTTSLARNLSMHPMVYMPEGEIHFFSKRLGQGDRWYKSFFKEPGKIQGEKSPTYLYYKECHREIHRLLPGVKLILLLRNPVDRAFSNWNMRYNDNRLIQQGLAFNRKYGNTLASLDFDKLLDFYLDNKDMPQVFEKPLDVFHRGLYIRQIESLLLFFHREQLLILTAERFFEDEQKGCDKVCRFLSIPPFKKRRFERQRVGDYKKEMPRKSRERLREFYLPYNRELFELLGESIREWQ